MNTPLFVTFNIFVIYMFPENFFEIRQVAQKIKRLSPSILTIFVNYLDSLTFSFYKDTNNVTFNRSCQQFFHLILPHNRLFNNYIKLYWYWVKYF